MNMLLSAYPGHSTAPKNDAFDNVSLLHYHFFHKDSVGFISKALTAAFNASMSIILQVQNQLERKSRQLCNVYKSKKCK
jgi:hypothetical protein